MSVNSLFAASALVGVLLIGAGCKPVQPALELPTAPPVERAEVDVSSPAGATDGGPDAEVPARKPYYVAYSAEGYAKAKAEGRPVLLYFWAGWCPICRAEEPKVKASVEGSAVAVAGFRVDYDVQEDMKKAFRVPYQHTTVILDTHGNESARFTGPTSDADLQAALAVAATR